MFDTVWQDVRYSARSLRRVPGFAALAVVTLAVVIGATTTIFSVASSLLLRPPGGEDPERLVRVFYARGANMLYPDYIEHRDSSRTMELAAFDDQRVSVRVAGNTEPAFAELLTANYFRVAGIHAALGRAFEPEDGTRDAAPVVVLSHAYWRQRFEELPSAVGWTIAINGVDFRVIGVAPSDFTGAYGFMAADLWMPITADPLLRPGTNQLVDRQRARGVQVVGRLRAGVSLEQARADAELIARDLQERFPGTATAGVSVQPASMLPGDIGQQATLFLGLLLGIAVLLLIAACANVANLLLARHVSAFRDMALRLSVGATRIRLVRQLLTESFLLAGIATVGALALTWVAMRALAAIAIPAPGGLPVVLEVALDWRVLAFAVGLAVLTTVACGLAPALTSTRSHLRPLIDATSGASARSRMRSVFIITQVASSVLLLIIGGLFVRSLESANRIDVGMDTSNVLLATIDTETRGYTEDRARRSYEEILSRLSREPDVITASLADITPLVLTRRAWNLNPRGEADDTLQIPVNQVSPGHFATLRIPLLDGRDFDARDTATSRPVVVLNQTLARRWFGARSPVGAVVQRPAFGPMPAREFEVIGVAADARYATVGEDQQPFAYFALAQVFSSAPTLMVRTGHEPLRVAPAVRRVIASIDDSLPVFGVSTFEAASGLSLLPARFAAGVSGTLGTLVLVLAALGLFGLVSFLARQRTREIGIRVALGAQPSAIVRLFVRQSLGWTVTGLGVGVVLAIGAAQLMKGLLYGVRPLDPATFGAVIALMVAVGFVASYVPSRWAASVNAVDALRG